MGIIYDLSKVIERGREFASNAGEPDIKQIWLPSAIIRAIEVDAQENYCLVLDPKYSDTKVTRLMGVDIKELK